MACDVGTQLQEKLDAGSPQPEVPETSACVLEGTGSSGTGVQPLGAAPPPAWLLHPG